MSSLSSFTNCLKCNTTLALKVLHSNAGYYLGTFCNNCGPHSRESDYFKTREQANTALTQYDTASNEFNSPSSVNYTPF